MNPPRSPLLLLSLVGGCSLALVALSSVGGSPAHSHSRTVSHPVSRSFFRPLPPTVPRPVRASRGGLRSALVPTGPSFSGTASWYGGIFQGRLTANGERFDIHALTAASRTLPFGTRLRVCRGQRCVVVRVNDRGPYVGARVLDLSHAAAQRLGFEGVELVTATPVVSRRVAAPAPRRPLP